MYKIIQKTLKPKTIFDIDIIFIKLKVTDAQSSTNHVIFLDSLKRAKKKRCHTTSVPSQRFRNLILWSIFSDILSLY